MLSLWFLKYPVFVSPNVRESKTVWRDFSRRIPVYRYWNLNSLSVELELRVPTFSVIPDSLRCISDSKAQDSGLCSKNFPDSRIWILLHKVICACLLHWIHLLFGLVSPKKSKTANGPPDTNDILCCEVCGKYGLRQEFSASGRFCSLSCVGVYTGRRNKGREFVRKVKTSDGKIVKKKKKGKGKKMGMAEKLATTAYVSKLL